MEFSRDTLLRDQDTLRLRNRAEVRSLHDPLVFVDTAGGKTFTLLNGGFPVNFDRDVVDRIAPEAIQFTAALMVHAAARATEVRSPGIHELGPGIGEDLHDLLKTEHA